MAIEASQVFLVPVQRQVTVEGGAIRLSPTIEHCVVVTDAPGSVQAAQQMVAQAMPGVMPVGFTSLAEFERAVVELRKVVAGEKTDWPLIVAPGLA